MKRNNITLFSAFVIMLSFLVFSCQDDNVIAPNSPDSNNEVQENVVQDETTDATDSENELVGLWSMTKVDYHFGGIRTFACGEFVYQFDDNGKLVVKEPSTTNMPIFLAVGEHNYKYDKDSKSLSIDDRTYYCTVADNVLTIDTGSASDGPVYTFSRR